MNKETIKRYLIYIGLLIAMVLAVFLFWPLLLVIGVVVAWQYYRAKKTLQNHVTSQTLTQDHLFYTQNHQKVPTGDIIDAEFVEKEKEE